LLALGKAAVLSLAAMRRRRTLVQEACGLDEEEAKKAKGVKRPAPAPADKEAVAALNIEVGGPGQHTLNDMVSRTSLLQCLSVEPPSSECCQM
jgi:hypothetical protein